VVAQRHPLATTPADGQPLEERWPFPWRASQAIFAHSQGVRSQALEIFLVRLPSDIAGMRVADEHWPLVALQLPPLLEPNRRRACPKTSVHERTRIARVVQDLEDAAEQKRPPHQLAFAWSGLDVTREEQILRLESAHCCRGCSSATEGLEQQPNGVLDLLIRIEDHSIQRIIRKADRQRHLQLTTPGFVQNAALQPRPQDVQLSFAHRALQPQQEAIVELTRVV
jgi:hypothetical protein